MPPKRVQCRTADARVRLKKLHPIIETRQINTVNLSQVLRSLLFHTLSLSFPRSAGGMLSGPLSKLVVIRLFKAI